MHTQTADDQLMPSSQMEDVAGLTPAYEKLLSAYSVSCSQTSSTSKRFITVSSWNHFYLFVVQLWIWTVVICLSGVETSWKALLLHLINNFIDWVTSTISGLVLSVIKLKIRHDWSHRRRILWSVWSNQWVRIDTGVYLSVLEYHSSDFPSLSTVLCWENSETHEIHPEQIQICVYRMFILFEVIELQTGSLQKNIISFSLWNKELLWHILNVMFVVCLCFSQDVGESPATPR